MKKVKRTYLHCEKLEEAPMWGSSNPGDQQLKVERAADLFREFDSFREACRGVLVEWPNSSMQNLSARVLNRKAWLGQAASYIQTGAVEYETRGAWRLICESERDTCNQIASDVIQEWEYQQCQK